MATKMGDIILTTETGRVLRASTGGLDEINSILHPHRKGVIAVDLTKDVPENLRAALQKTGKITEEEHEGLMKHFEPSRERHVEIIRSSGFEPHHEGGGELHCSTSAGPGGQKIKYPVLWELPIGSPPNNGFFELHINYDSEETDTTVAEMNPDASKLINEAHIVLSGNSLWWHVTDKEGVCKVEVVAGTDRAWIMHYSGTSPHGAILPTPETMPLRIMSCIIGAPNFVTFYKHPSIPRINPWTIDGVLDGSKDMTE